MNDALVIAALLLIVAGATGIAICFGALLERAITGGEKLDE